jgi:hypothetical protein
VDLNCSACGGSGEDIVESTTALGRMPKEKLPTCKACDGTGRKIEHGHYLISIEICKGGYVAWIETMDGQILVRYDGSSGPKIGTRTYMERDPAIQAARQAIDDGEVS